MGFKKKLCLLKEKTRTRNKHTLWCFVYSLLFSTFFHHSYPSLNVTKVVKCFLVFFGDFKKNNNNNLFVCFFVLVWKWWICCSQIVDVLLGYYIYEFPILGYPLVLPNLATCMIWRISISWISLSFSRSSYIHNRSIELNFGLRSCVIF